MLRVVLSLLFIFLILCVFFVLFVFFFFVFFFFSSRRRHTRWNCDWSSDVCSSDLNAAGSGAILGVIKGNKWLQAQGWNIKDLYRNTSRDDLPQDETITSYGRDRKSACRERV